MIVLGSYYLNVYASLMKRPYSFTFPTFQYLQLTKNILHIFLNVTIKPGSNLRLKLAQDSVNTVDISATQADVQRRQRSRTGKKK